MTEVSNGDMSKWPSNIEEAFVCEEATVDDCYISFKLDTIYLMTGIETDSSMSSQCFPKILNIEYSVTKSYFTESFQNNNLFFY